ncbi:MAG: 23S rRNA (adenine(2503)-C(2))-methyltransferase RlmN [Mycoplasma sp.]
MKQNNIYDYTYEKLKDFFVQNDIKPFVAKQVFDWLYKKLVNSFDEMVNIKKTTIDFLKQNFEIPKFKIVTLLEDEDLTTKFLFELPDGNKIETVVMNFEYGNSICVTTQVGCNMGCKFCASGKLKKIRDLTAGEIILQVKMANQYLLENERNTLRNIVVMGIGEPFDNYDNLKDFLNIVRDDLSFGIGSRKITVSTCGLLNKFGSFQNDFNQIGLAISLHAPTNEIRDQIMPINQKFRIEELIDKAREYTEHTNRRVTFEYIMLEGINDSTDDAHELADLLYPIKNELFTINLIPYNSVSETEFKRSRNIRPFYEVLREYGIITTVRQEKGANINGACGQLRADTESN